MTRTDRSGRKSTPIDTMLKSPQDWARDKEARFEDKVVRYLAKRYRLDVWDLYDPEDEMRHPDCRTHNTILASFHRVLHTFPMRFHVAVLAPKQLQA